MYKWANIKTMLLSKVLALSILNSPILLIPLLFPPEPSTKMPSVQSPPHLLHVTESPIVCQAVFSLV